MRQCIKLPEGRTGNIYAAKFAGDVTTWERERRAAPLYHTLETRNRTLRVVNIVHNISHLWFASADQGRSTSTCSRGATKPAQHHHVIHVSSLSLFTNLI